MAQAPFALVPAAYVYLLRDDHVFLQLRQGTGYMDGRWAASAAGHVEPGETVHQGAVRELREELGVVVDAATLQPLTVMHRTSGTPDPVEQRVDWFFAADTWSGEPTVMEPAKCAAARWFPLSSLPDPMPEYEHEVLSGYVAGDLPAFTHHGFAN